MIADGRRAVNRPRPPSYGDSTFRSTLTQAAAFHVPSMAAMHSGVRRIHRPTRAPGGTVRPSTVASWSERRPIRS